MGTEDSTPIGSLMADELEAAEEMKTLGDDYGRDNPPVEDPMPGVEDPAEPALAEPAPAAETPPVETPPAAQVPTAEQPPAKPAPAATPSTEPVVAATPVETPPVVEQSAEPSPKWVDTPVGSVFAPQFKVERTMEELTAEQERLNTGYEDGSIEAEEYHEGIRGVDRDLIQLEMAEDFNRQSQEHLVQNENARWAASEAAFCTLPGNDVYLTDRILRGALDSALQEIYKEPEFANRAHMDYLTEANRRVRDRFGTGIESQDGDKPATPVAPPPPNRQNTGGRGTNRDSIPQTLGNLPQAEKNDEAKRFGDVDKDGLEGEVGFSKLSPEDQDAWLRE